jgi:hypothetical protein
MKNNVETRFIGTEPIIFGRVEDSKDPRLIQAFNWYNYNYSVEQGKVWLMSAMKKLGYTKEQIDVVKSAATWRTSMTACSYAKMILNGTELSEHSMEFLRSRIEENIKNGTRTKVAKTETKPVVDVQARIREKASNTIAEVEEQVDIHYFYNKKFSLYEFLRKNEVSGQIAGYVKDYYTKQNNELQAPDAQIKEAYGKKLKFAQDFFASIIDDCDRYIGNKNTTRVRKPRATKEKPLTKIVEQVKYQKEFGKLKLVSANPIEIVKASTVWLYNTKYNTISVINASGPAGLSVKGTSIVNFDEETSITKTLKKPEDNLKIVLTGGKVALKKFMPSINSKEYKATGRMNSDTIILKVVK